MSRSFADVLLRAAAQSAATLHEAAGRIGALPAAIKPLSTSLTLCGPALPVRMPPGDNLWLHHALYAAAPGDVLVVETGGALEYGHWGEVMAVAAIERGIAGLVIDGGVRDKLRLNELNFPVFAASVCIRGTAKNPAGDGSIGLPVRLGDASIHRGDVIVGDAVGVVVIPSADIERVVNLSERREAEEREIFARLRRGDSTLDIYGLPDPVA